MSSVALVTGGSRGIGAAISKALKEAGYTVAANYAGNDDAAKAFTAETGIKTYKWSVADYDACAAGIKQVEAEQTTASGLVIPDTAKEKPQEGKVVATGPGRIDDNGNRVPLDVAEGDVVIFSKYGGTEVKYDGQEYLLLNARDILAIVQK